MSFADKLKDVSDTDNSTFDIEKSKKAAEYFEPAFDRILIKRGKSNLEKRTTKSGLLLPDSVKENVVSSEGILLKCGPTCDEEAISLVGKKILFAKYSGEDITVSLPDGTSERFVLATDRDIFGELK